MFITFNMLESFCVSSDMGSSTAVNLSNDIVSFDSIVNPELMDFREVKDPYETLFSLPPKNESRLLTEL